MKYKPDKGWEFKVTKPKKVKVGKTVEGVIFHTDIPIKGKVLKIIDKQTVLVKPIIFLKKHLTNIYNQL